MSNILWNIIKIYIFTKPFMPEAYFRLWVLAFNSILLFSGSIYILKRRVKLTHIDILISLFLSGLIISVIFSNNITNSLSSLFGYITMIVLFYAVRSCGEDNKRGLFFVLISSALLVSIYSLASVFIISRFVTEFLSNNPGYAFAGHLLAGKRAHMPFIIPNLLASYLVMISIFSLGLIIQNKNKSKSGVLYPLCLFSLPVNISVLFLTKSIGGWLVLILSVFIFLAAAGIDTKKRYAAILLLSICLIVMLLMRIEQGAEFTKPTFSVTQRISYWRETLSIIRKNPLTGVGIGNFCLRDSVAAHNSYLQIWAEMGILGIASWLGIISLFIKRGIERLRRNEGSYYILGTLLSGLAFLFHNLIDFGFFVPEVSFLWWIMLGLIFA